jgi:hypothetical protein
VRRHCEAWRTRRFRHSLIDAEQSNFHRHFFWRQSAPEKIADDCHYRDSVSILLKRIFAV